MKITKYIILAGVVCLATSAISVASAEKFDIISPLSSDYPNIKIWRIDKPNVTKKSVDYPQITFQPGDCITVSAGGCAQTGGAGKTWKRFVDPQGPNADRLYHGLINLSGVTHGLTRLKDFPFGIEHQVPANGSAGHLQLGYEDDGYGDNGYWGRDGDDGTGGQCKGLPNAYVIIAVRHGGQPPADPARLVQDGIPHSDFRHEGAWRFGNFDTSEMSWDSFTDAFNLGWTDYLNPVTYIMYLAGRGMASGGNCAGMCLLADAGEKEWVLSDNLAEAFWPDFSQHQPVQYDINVAHWRQLSVYFVKSWLHSLFDSNATIVNKIDADIKAGRYGLLSMQHGTEGHVIVPLSVERLKNGEVHIHVYNPNTPCTALPDKEANFAPLIVKGGAWSFPMGGDTWTQAGGSIAYVPYAIDGGWRDLVNSPGDVLAIIFGEGTSVDQITDGSGRHLFVKPGASTIANTDFSAKGLGHDIVRMQIHSKNTNPVGPPRFGLHKAAPESPEMGGLAKQMLTDYQREYGTPREVYLVMNQNLKNLTIQTSTKTAGAGAKFIAGSRQGFVEIRTAPADKAHMIQPNFTIRSLADLSAGVSMQDRNGTAHKTTFLRGTLQTQLQQMQIERSSEMTAGAAAVELRASGALKMAIRNAGNLESLKIESQVIDAKGVKRDIGATTLMQEKLN